MHAQQVNKLINLIRRYEKIKLKTDESPLKKKFVKVSKKQKEAKQDIHEIYRTTLQNFQFQFTSQDKIKQKTKNSKNMFQNLQQDLMKRSIQKIEGLPKNSKFSNFNVKMTETNNFNEYNELKKKLIEQNLEKSTKSKKFLSTLSNSNNWHDKFSRKNLKTMKIITQGNINYENMTNDGSNYNFSLSCQNSQRNKKGKKKIDKIMIEKLRKINPIKVDRLVANPFQMEDKKFIKANKRSKTIENDKQIRLPKEKVTKSTFFNSEKRIEISRKKSSKKIDFELGAWNHHEDQIYL